MLHHLGSLLSLPTSSGLSGVAAELAAWRWQLLPWDRQTIDAVSALAQYSKTHAVPDWALISSGDPEPEFFQSIQAISDNQPDDVAQAWRRGGMRSTDPAWLGETCLYFLQRGDEALVSELLATTALDPGHPVASFLNALRVFAFEPPEIALRAVRQLPEDFRLIRTLLEAQCLLSLDREAAIPLLKHLWTKLPWHPNLVFKLHSLLAPPHGPAQPGPDTAVLLYSWNNADLLETTLQSLARSDLGGAVVMILDNGSTDHTPAVVREAASLFGDRLKRLRIPVNIGAPAARNWLLSHPETQPFRTVVFLDDDVLLPAQWLTELSARHRQAPTGSIVGCRIMDQTPRKSVQTADVNLLEIEDDGDFLIANSGGGELDLGLHDYNRPCLSVTGCCHMMDRERALELGGFDLRFNPSQFDDFDLDLRNALAGGQAFYAGGTGIMHCQRSSLSQADSEAKRGHIQGNMLKLNTKYTPQQKAELLRRNREMLWDDLLAKTRDLENL
jgi:GT2 family glycosyltransferase